MAEEETTETTEEETSEETTEETSQETTETEKVNKDDDWQAKARKHEREAKRLRKQIADKEAEERQRADADKTEQQKAIDKAKEEGRTEALTEAQKERRHDRLEAKCATVAARGIKVKDGDEEKVLKFADPDDALVYIERAIREGDVDEEDIFDSEGKVNTDALTSELGNLLERKPHLAAESNGGRPSGSADGGRGTPDTDLESMTPEDHAKRKYGASK
jgi:hypothetical protein